MPEPEAGEESPAAETALAHLRLETAGAGLANQIGVPRLGEALFLDDAPEGKCGVWMHAHMTRVGGTIFPRRFPTREPGSSSR